MASRRRRWVILSVLGALAATLFVAAAIVVGGRIPLSSEALRARAERYLAEHLDADVRLGELTLSVFPRLRVKGTDLAVRHNGRRDVPPLISVKRFTVDADLVGLWRRRINRIDLEGLDIQIPPDARPDLTPNGDAAPEADPSAARDIVVSELRADGARLVILPRNPEKPSRVWQLHELRMQDVGAARPMRYQAVLTNAIPPGRIVTDGTLGPWHARSPGATPLDGRFTFKKADLGFFKGIGGTLSAHGTYRGQLDRLDINGQTETPDFLIDVGGHPVPLSTTYHAIVDGTNGDTTLERIDATFLETSLVAKGGVYDVKGVKGRLVTLDISMDEGRLEDLMRLAVDTPTAPMTGTIHLETKFDLPPGEADVVERLLLKGRFAIQDGRFASPEVQGKIAELSRKASGGAAGATADGDAKKRQGARTVSSDFSGRFSLGKGTLSLPAVAFDVPGAAVRLAGRYGLRNETIAFKGDLFMDAKISQTTTGWKSLLLKVVDPLFRRDGRTVIPIKIEGTRHAPSFGLDMGRVFNRD